MNIFLKFSLLNSFFIFPRQTHLLFENKGKNQKPGWLRKSIWSREKFNLVPLIDPSTSVHVNERNIRFTVLRPFPFKGRHTFRSHDHEKPCNSTTVHFISWLEQRSARSLAPRFNVPFNCIVASFHCARLDHASNQDR